MVMVPEQLPNLIDRAIRIALAARAPDLHHRPDRRAGARVLAAARTRSRWCPRASASAGPRRPGRRRDHRAAEILNAGRRWRCWSGRAPAAPPPRSTEVADLLGAGVAKALLGKDVLPDDLPWVTGAIGLLGTRPSYEMMRAATRC